MVLKTGDMIPQSNDTFGALGLIGINGAGDYVVQAYGQLRDDLDGAFIPQPSALINGNVSATVEAATLLCASAGLQGAQPEFTGDTVMGPRIGPDNVVAQVLHPTQASHALIVRNANGSQVVVQDAALSTGGDIVVGISAPIVAKNGLCYYQAFTDTGVVTGTTASPGMELSVSNGSVQKTLLTRGDTINNQTPPLIAFWSGFHSDQIDNAGRVVFMAEFGDNAGVTSEVTTSLVVGIPV